jgi:beta-carotene 15,15'-dioxygenase
VRSALRTATVVSLAAAATGLAVELLVPGGWGQASWGVLAAGLLLGLPHGAVDHVVLTRRLGTSPGRLVGVTAGYAALAGACLLLFRAEPRAGLLVFVALSVWHFGTGETAVADLRAGVPVRRRAPAALVVGSVVLLVPLARPFPEVAAVLSGVLPGSAEGPLLPPAVVPLVGTAALLLAAGLLLHRRRLEALEVATLLAVAVVLPPPAAFGLYVGAWHSLRHLGRLLAEDPANAADLLAGRVGAPLRRFTRTAALPTAAAAAGVALLGADADGWPTFVAAALPVVAALTVPHALVVGWLDRQQGRGGPQPEAAAGAGRRIGTCGMPSST